MLQVKIEQLYAKIIHGRKTPIIVFYVTQYSPNIWIRCMLPCALNCPADVLDALVPRVPPASVLAIVGHHNTHKDTLRRIAASYPQWQVYVRRRLAARVTAGQLEKED